MLLNGIGPSMTITVPAFFLNLFVTISIALVCAYYRNSILDRTLVVLAVIGMSINIVILCILVQTLAGTDAKFLGVPIGLQNYGFPVWGFEGPRYLILPLLIGLITGVGGGVRFYRTVMLNERYSEYVRTAQAKGVGEPAIMFKHVLKNAMIPILTNVVIAIPFLYTGALLLENFFGIPGIGFLTVQAINNGDEAVLFASVYLGAILFVIANLLTDISYAIADPRVRLK
jgi:peptide/nickel transport system permease protein